MRGRQAESGFPPALNDRHTARGPPGNQMHFDLSRSDTSFRKDQEPESDCGLGSSSAGAPLADTRTDCAGRQKTPDMFTIFLIASVLSDAGAL